MKRSSRFLSIVLTGMMTCSLSLPFTAQAQEYSYFGQWMQTVVLQSITASMNESVSTQDDAIAVQNDPTQADPASQEDPAATTTPSPDEVAEAPKKDEILSTALKPGDNSHEVTLLQTRLMELECFDSDEATGLYGSVTTEAVKLFQRSNDLKIDGVAGQETIQLMFSDQAKKYVAKQGDSGSDVASIQRRLAELNYFNDKVTGYYGAATTAAVKAFQKKNKLTEDGKVGVRTKDVLYSAKAVATKATSTPKPSATKKPSSTSKPTSTSKPSTNNKGVSGLLQFAQAQLGKKYVTGNEGPNSFDCSGFVYYCLKNSGVNVGRLSAKGYSQNTNWASVSKSNLKAGDLLFFSVRGGSSVGHVGIYLGNNKMIHCSSSKGQVVITNITTSYWVTNYKSARRVF